MAVESDEQAYSCRCPLLATDIIIEYSNGKKEGIVLITRRNFPHGLALPGGFAEIGLSLEENAVKEGKEETGLEVVISQPEQPLCVRSEPHRDPRGHVVSVAYVGKGSGILKAGDDAETAGVYSIDELISLCDTNNFVFDHREIIEAYLRHRGYIK